MTFPVFIKASASRISIAKEVREVNKLRMSLERSMTRSVYQAISEAGERAAREFEARETIGEALTPLRERLEDVFRAHYDVVVNTFAKRVYDNRKLTPFRDLVFELYEREGAAKVVAITETTRRQILRAIRQGDKEGLGVAKIAKLIVEKTSGSIGRSRAATIARTETHAAASWATHTATKELNLPAQKKRWVSVGDARTRAHHAAANGQEVGIDEPFIIRYLGAEIPMQYPHDGNGGAANNINCRCVAVYFTDVDQLIEDLEAEADGFRPPPQPAAQPTEEVDVFADIPVGEEFVNPVLAGITNQTFRQIMQGGKEARNKALQAARADVSKAAEDKRYLPNNQMEFGGRHQFMAGEFTVGDLSDEAVTAIALVNKELNYMADWLGVPRLRGYTMIDEKGNAIANMGDGIMGINAKYFNNFAKNTDMDDVAFAKLVEEFNDLQSKRVKWRDELRLVNGKIWDGAEGDALRKLEDRKRELQDLLVLGPQNDRWIALSEQIEKHQHKALWRVGDDPKDKPWTADEFFAHGIQHIRSTMYHEFGHHVHQMYKKVERRYISMPPLEEELKRFWKAFAKKKRRNEITTAYAETNEKEFFVEGFALYFMGRKDLVHPKVRALIERIMDERGS